MIFNTLDADGDGYINIHEYGYAILYYMFQSGPDSVISLLFGPVAPEKITMVTRLWVSHLDSQKIMLYTMSFFSQYTPCIDMHAVLMITTL